VLRAAPASPYILAPCERAAWDEFVAASPQGNVFCATLFLDVLGAETEFWLVREGGNALLGALVLRKNGRVVRAPHPFTMYQGVLLSRGLAELPRHSRYQKLLRSMEFLFAELEQRCDSISFCLHHSLEDLRAFSWFHYHEPEKGQFRIDLRYTGLLDTAHLKDWEGFIDSLRRLRQREYRKACSSGLTVRISRDVETLQRLHDLTFARQGLASSEAEQHLLRSITQAALEHGFGELLECVERGGKVTASTLFLYDRSCAYSLFGATDPEDRDTGSYTYLILENLRRCRERVALVDFVGINSPNRGDYKLSFNFEPRPYFIATWEKPAPSSAHS
jgi:hypothetical protein